MILGRFGKEGLRVLDYWVLLYRDRFLIEIGGNEVSVPWGGMTFSGCRCEVHQGVAEGGPGVNVVLNPPG